MFVLYHYIIAYEVLFTFLEIVCRVTVESNWSKIFLT